MNYYLVSGHVDVYHHENRPDEYTTSKPAEIVVKARSLEEALDIATFGYGWGYDCWPTARQMEESEVLAYTGAKALPGLGRLVRRRRFPLVTLELVQSYGELTHW